MDWSSTTRYPMFSHRGGWTVANYTYEWHCCACKAVAAETHRAFPGHEIIIPSLPMGWRFTMTPDGANMLYCPAHELKVSVFVDGKEQL